MARLAARQHGVVSSAQLRKLGLSAQAIRYRAQTGRLHLIHHGVYGVGYHPTAPLACAMAAVLACGERAALSHRSAAALWGIVGTWPARAEVTAASRRRPAGMCVHHSRTLTRAHVAYRHAICVTRPARTLLDLAEVLDDRALARAVNEALVLGLVSQSAGRAITAEARGRHRAQRLTALLVDDPMPTHSELEDAFLDFAKRQGLPRPATNQRLGSYVVDILWPSHRVVVELDGFRFHGHRQAFERDRERDAELVSAGYRVVRVTWRRLTSEPEQEARRLRLLLDT